MTIEYLDGRAKLPLLGKFDERDQNGSPRNTGTIIGALVFMLALVIGTFTTSGPVAAGPIAPPEYLVVGATGSQAVRVIRVNGGVLTEVSGAPSDAQFSLGLIGHPNHRFVYSAGVASGTIQGWALSRRGVLKPLPGGVMRIGEPVTGMAISPDGRYMVTSVGSLRTTLVTYRISQTGGLSRVAETPQPHLISPLGHPLFAPDGQQVVPHRVV